MIDIDNFAQPKNVIVLYSFHSEKLKIKKIFDLRIHIKYKLIAIGSDN